MKAELDLAPMTVALSAGNTPFMYYTGGIINSTACNRSVDHAIGILGYGTEGTTDYWIVRNSWGVGWGEGGYGRIKIDASGPGGATNNYGYCYS